MRLLITGGAGFIGSTFIRYALSHITAERLVNVDSLTYAGNLDNLAGVTADPRYRFAHADICDGAAIEAKCAVSVSQWSPAGRAGSDAPVSPRASASSG